MYTMKNNYYLCLSVVACLFAYGANAQPWMTPELEANPDFHQIQQNFNSYWQGKPYEKGQGIKPFQKVGMVLGKPLDARWFLSSQ